MRLIINLYLNNYFKKGEVWFKSQIGCDSFLKILAQLFD